MNILFYLASVKLENIENKYDNLQCKEDCVSLRLNFNEIDNWNLPVLY